MGRGRMALVAAVAVALAAGLAPLPAAAGTTGPPSSWVATVTAGADVDAVAAALGGTPIGPADVRLHATDREAAAAARHPAVAAVERDAPAVAVDLPADPCLLAVDCPTGGDQRGLHRVGAEGAWEVVSSAAGVTVAVVDGGVDTSHPDLAGRAVAVAPGTPAGCAALPAERGTTDRTASGHGTRVAGLIAAAADGRGIAGMAWGGVTLRSYAALGPDLRGSTADVAAAVHCAVDDGADVINLSLTAGDTTAMRNALDRAEAAGVVVVAAAGNGGDGQHPGPWPAAHPTVLAVTAVDEGGRRAAFANGGAWVDLAAPGTAVTSTAPGGGWSVRDGTSYAAPLVTGAVALLLARAGDLAPAAVRERLLATAEPLDDPSTGRGLLDASAAVRLPGPAACTVRTSGWMLDAYGGLHPFGGAPTVATGAYWPGWDIARDLATAPGLPGGYVLDGFGGLHAFGGAPRIASPAYRPGRDLARAADRRADGSVVVVDGEGLLHVAGGGRPMGSGGPWFAGADLARDVVVDPRNPTRAWILDAHGGVHRAGAGSAAPAAAVERTTPGRDLARRLVVLPDGRRGYVLFADGRVSRWAVAGVALPPATGPAAFPYGAGRGLDADGEGRLVIAAGAGAVLSSGARACRPAARFGGNDLVRAVALH